MQQNSRKLLIMDILMSEICWAHKKWNKIANYIKSVFYSSVSSKSVTKVTKTQKLKQQKVRYNTPDMHVRAGKLAMEQRILKLSIFLE